MSLLNKIAVGALATVGVLAVKNRKAIANEVKTDLGRAKRAVKVLPTAAREKLAKRAGPSKSAAKSAAKRVARKTRKLVTSKKRSASTKRTKTRK